MPCFIIKGNTPQAAINAFLNNNSSISKGRKGQTCWCTPVVSVPWRLEDGRFSVQGQPRDQPKIYEIFPQKIKV